MSKLSKRGPGGVTGDQSMPRRHFNRAVIHRRPLDRLSSALERPADEGDVRRNHNSVLHRGRGVKRQRLP